MVFLSQDRDALCHAPEAIGQAVPTRRRKGRRRRGATALEYLVMTSFVIVVCILVIQHLGLVTGGLMQSNAAATSKTVQQ